MMNTIFFTLLLFLHPGCNTAKDIVLVENGKARHKIVLPADATPAEKRAAAILKDYIGKMSGATLAQIGENVYQEGEAAIFIGNTGHAEKFGTAKIKGEGFLIATDDKHLYIRGGSGKGIIYGVYTLLEQYFGCRKYAAEAAFVPSKKTIGITPQLTDLQEPQFVYRETYYPAPLDAEYQEWHKLHSFEDLWGLWGHSYFKLVPPKQYFSAHPEYYALVNGKRQATQLCLSDEQVFRITTDYFRKAIADNPDALYWSISPEDGSGYCTCDLCSAADKEEGSHSGSLIRFVNRVAAVFPEHQFTTLAYTYTLQPPARTKPASNVVIMLSSIDAYRNQPLEDAPSAASFRKALAEWKNISNKIFVWDYTTQFTNYLAPFPDYFLLQQNLQYFANNGVTGVFSQGSGGTYSDMAELNAYLQAKALWQPGTVTDKAFSDFMIGYYGPAAPFITKYLEALARNLQSSKAPLDIYGSPVNDHTSYLTPAFIDEYSTLLDQAEKTAGDDAKLAEKISRARLPLEYTVLQQSRIYGAEKYGYLVPSGKGFAPDPKWPVRVKRFVRQAKQAGVTELAEGGFSPDAYQQEWEQLLAKPWQSSFAFRKKVTLQHPFTPEYTANNEATLTDGITGGKDFSLNWLFVYGNDLVATIDLGQTQKLSNIQLNFLQDARHNIFLPTTIIVEVSVDGRSFQQVTQQAVKAVEEEDFSAHVKTYKLAFNANAKFVRVTAKCLPKMPLWRGNDKKPAVCCDEVLVN